MHTDADKIYNAAMITKLTIEYQIRAMGMQAENAVRACRGATPAYDSDHFFTLVDEMEAYIKPFQL